MYDEAWDKVVKLVFPGNRKTKASNGACVLPILFSIYLNPHLCLSKLSSDDMLLILVVDINQTLCIQVSCECH